MINDEEAKENEFITEPDECAAYWKRSSNLVCGEEVENYSAAERLRNFAEHLCVW